MIRKTLIIISIFIVIIFTYGHANVIQTDDFLASAIASIAADATATNGSEFTSLELDLVSDDGLVNTDGIATVEITFTGDGSMDGSNVEFYFQVSLDGTNWSTDEYVKIYCASDAEHVSDVVRHSEPITAKWKKIRLWKVFNDDAANEITDVNAKIAF